MAQQTQKTNNALSGIQTRDLSSQAAAHLQLRPHDHRHGPSYSHTCLNFAEMVNQFPETVWLISAAACDSVLFSIIISYFFPFAPSNTYHGE